MSELRAGVQKKALAHDIKQAMKSKGLTPSEMARRMRTSREAVYRLLDPTRTSVTLDSLQRAALALGLTLNISFEHPARQPATRPAGAAGSRKRAADHTRILSDGQKQVAALMPSRTRGADQGRRDGRIRFTFHQEKFEVANPASARTPGGIEEMVEVFAPDADLPELTRSAVGYLR